MPNRDTASSRRSFLVRASAAATLAATAALLDAPGIDSVPKLAGKRVAATGGTALHYFLARVLAKFDMKLSDVDFVNLAAADGQAAFVAGRVDAIVPSVNGRFYITSTRKDTREPRVPGEVLHGSRPDQDGAGSLEGDRDEPAVISMSRRIRRRATGRDACRCIGLASSPLRRRSSPHRFA